jgi:hypothetical protein
MGSTHARVIFSDEWQILDISSEVDTETVQLLLPAIGIDEVRAITAEAYRRPTSGSRKHIVVRTASITNEAQNAFLKTLEEPPGETSITIVLPVGITLLPTIKSRVHIHADTGSADTSVFDGWVLMGLAERLVTVEAAAKRKDDDFFIAMKLGLRNYLAMTSGGITPDARSAAHYVLLQLRTRGASNKMLLEELALSIPVSSS